MHACGSHYRGLCSCRFLWVVSPDHLKQLEHADIRKITLTPFKYPDRVLEWIFRMYEYVPQSPEKLFLIDSSWKYHADITGSGFYKMHKSRGLRKTLPACLTEFLPYFKQNDVRVWIFPEWNIDIQLRGIDLFQLFIIKNSSCIKNTRLNRRNICNRVITDFNRQRFFQSGIDILGLLPNPPTGL